MTPLRDVAAIRRAEAAAFTRTPAATLMQRAAFAVAVECARLLAGARGSVVGARVVLLVGAGNNGGDALWAGAYLTARGCAVTAVAVADRYHDDGARALRTAGGRLVAAADPLTRRALGDADLVVDGILGIGGSGALREPAAGLVADVGDAIVVAVDVPSGVDADTGVVAGTAVDADVTVTFGAPKPGLFLAPGRAHAGSVRVVDIGLTFAEPAATHVLDDVDVAAWVREPPADAHKYSRGVAALATGSPTYPGAAYLSVAGALAADVGMVRYYDRGDGLARAVVDRWWDVVVDGSAPAEQSRATAWGCGSGMAGTPEDEPMVAAVLATRVPVLLDAGAVLALGRSEALRDLVRERADHGLTTVLTPHDGEFARTFPGVLDAAAGRLAAARAVAAGVDAIVLLKGPGTIVAAPDGTAFVDGEGTADLAIAGSGDVLTGLATGLLAGAWARGWRTPADLARAVAAAVWLHGRAGRIAAAAGTVTARAVAAAVPAAIAAARYGGPMVTTAARYGGPMVTTAARSGGPAGPR